MVFAHVGVGFKALVRKNDFLLSELSDVYYITVPKWSQMNPSLAKTWPGAMGQRGTAWGHVGMRGPRVGMRGPRVGTRGHAWARVGI